MAATRSSSLAKSAAAGVELLSPARKGASQTLRDLSDKCSVRHLFGDYFEVRNELGQPYRVKCWMEGADFVALCQCRRRVILKRECRHEVAALRFERRRVNSAQFGS